MATHNSMAVFLRTVIAVAAAAGAVAGLLMGAHNSLDALRAGTLPASEIVYLALLGIAILVIVASLLVGRRTSLVLIVGFVALGAALSGLLHAFTGKIADFVLWLSAFSFGVAIGLLLAGWTRRAAGPK